MAETQEPTRLRRIFIGSEGLRAGWGIALFLVLPALLTVLYLLLAHYFPLLVKGSGKPIEMTPGVVAGSEAFEFAVFGFVAFLISLLERRPFTSYGFAPAGALPDFAKGLGWGFAMLSVLVGLLYATHTIAFHGLALHGLPTFGYGLYWAVAFFFVALLEEFLFRGYLQQTLTRGLTAFLPWTPAFWVAAAILSGAIFAWVHTSNGGETAWGIGAVALAGLTFAFALYRTGSLWWAIGFHAAWDWAQSYFYGTPDSGNLARGHLLATTPMGNPILSGASAGPEGSVLVIPTLLLTCLIIHLTLPRRIYTST